MDPNATLHMIRTLCSRIDDTLDNDVRSVLAGELAECITDLDEWLERGGFLPDAWARR